MPKSGTQAVYMIDSVEQRDDRLRLEFGRNALQRLLQLRGLYCNPQNIEGVFDAASSEHCCSQVPEWALKRDLSRIEGLGAGAHDQRHLLACIGQYRADQAANSTGSENSVPHPLVTPSSYPCLRKTSCLMSIEQFGKAAKIGRAH